MSVSISIGESIFRLSLRLLLAFDTELGTLTLEGIQHYESRSMRIKTWTVKKKDRTRLSIRIDDILETNVWLQCALILFSP